MAGLFQKGDIMYQAELFFNTGFNAVNIPDSELTLRQAASSIKSYPALDILQPTGLTTVRLKALYEQVIGADYLLLRSQENPDLFCFYAIASAPIMTSVDVASLYIVEDPILTAGGIDNLTFLDGITSRHHIASEDDTFGSYIEDDPYLTLTETPDYYSMELFDKGPMGEWSSVDGPVMVITSTINLEDISTLTMSKISVQNDIQGSGSGTDFSFTLSGNNNFKYAPPANGAKSTVFADVKPNFSTMIAAGGEGQVNPIEGVDEYPVGAIGYSSNYEQGIVAFGQVDLIRLDQQISEIVGLGLESVVIDAVMIPKSFCKFNDGINDPYSDGWYSRGRSNIGCIQAVGAFYLPDDEGEFAYEYDGEVHNKRVLYGKYNGYSLISKATGSSTEILPEDMLYHNGQSTMNLAYGKGPVPMCLPDIRTQGRPYFNFAHIKSSGDSFMNGAISGSQWRKATLVSNMKSGSLLEEANFRRIQNEKDFWASDIGMFLQQGGDAGVTGMLQYAKDQSNLLIPIAETGFNTVFGTGEGMLSGSPESGLVAAASGVRDILAQANRNKARQQATETFNRAIWDEHLSAKRGGTSAYDAAMAGDPLALPQYERERERNVEIQSFLQNVSIFDPGFKINTDASLRDINGNGVYFLRKTPTAKDRARHDKILTQFGYKITEPITAAMLKNRRKFNYVQAGGVTVDFVNSTYYGKYLKERVAEVFNTGVRIWHVKPDVAYYTNGENI